MIVKDKTMNTERSTFESTMHFLHRAKRRADDSYVSPATQAAWAAWQARAALGPLPDPHEMRPAYFVRHPDGGFSLARPQPEQVSEPSDYAQCDFRHGGSCCEDPDCYRASQVLRPVSPA